MSMSDMAGPMAGPVNARLAEAQGGDERVARLRLARSENVGPRSFVHLLSRFGSGSRALDSLPRLAGRGGRDGYVACPADDAAREIERGEAAGGRLVMLGDPDYPERLAAIASAPPVLWVRGDASRLAGRTVAIVGARNASALGLRQARRLGLGLARVGEVVVSGLARGVDAAAHEGALAAMAPEDATPPPSPAVAASEGAAALRGQNGAGKAPAAPPQDAWSTSAAAPMAIGEPGTTVAVLPGGIDVIYPPENAGLAERIVAAGGALISECAPGTEPTSRHFPRRNRLISGLADGVVLIEAALRSGSLITARTALEQGREVMACPGAPEDPRAGGCNALIREGAGLVRDQGDVIETLGALRRRGLAEEADDFLFDIAFDDPLEALDFEAGEDDGTLVDQVLSLVGHAPVETDEIARVCGANPAQLALALLELELAGRILMMPGGQVVTTG